MRPIARLASGLLYASLVAACTSHPVEEFCETPPGAPVHTCSTYVMAELGVCEGSLRQVGDCPTASELGTCSLTSTVSGSEEDTYASFYSDNGETAAQAKAECLMQPGATWTPK